MSDTRPGRPIGEPPPREPFVRVATRGPDDRSRTSPRMRFDLLQVAAWASGLFVIVCALVGLARAGFDELTLFDPAVEVAGLAMTPLLALLLLLVGSILLYAATGEVDERSLRIGGVLLGIVGVVWVIEPGAFTPYLGIERGNGIAALALGALLVATSFVPPLSIRRPGVPPRRF